MKQLRNLLLAVATATSTQAQPVWTQIMDQTGQSTEASGQYYQMNNGSITHANNTDVASYPYMQIPSGPPFGGTNDSYCTSPPSWWTASVPAGGIVRGPQSRLESNYGPASGSYKGIGIYGTFGGGSVTGSGGSILEAVYFNEQKCYFGGREYGFFYNPATDNLTAYWSTNSNCGTSNCSAPSGYNSGTEISGPTAGTFTQPGTGWSTSGSYCGSTYPCYFAMYPVASGSSCYFEVEIIGGSPPVYVTYYSSPTPDVNAASQSPSVTSADPNFCSAIEAEDGYFTAGIVYTPTLTSFSSSIELWLDQQSFTSGMYVGK